MVKRFGRRVLVATFSVALTAAFVLPAGDAMAFSEPIPTKISLLKWGGNPKVGKLYKIVSKAPNPPLFTLPDPDTSDPVANGGSLKVTVGAGTLECTLPGGASWKALGNPAGSKGYKYVNKAAPTGDPCKIVIVKEKVIKVLAKSVGDIAEPGPPGSNPDVRVDLTVGTDDYCALAVGPHFKEKEATLIKMKSQSAPGVCVEPVCGDNEVNVVGEQCDGTDASACPGLCQGNCRCPEPLCGNGVLEAGEDCEPPCSEESPCGGGTICGAGCTCVPNVPCDCGSPDPSLFQFTTMTGTGDCGEVRDGSDVKLADLGCAKSWLGGGLLGSFAIKGTGIPLGTNIHKVECCYGTTLILGPTTAEETGDRKTCTSVGCALGGPVPTITTPALISVCSANYIEADSFGYMDCSSGEGFISIPMESDTHLVGDTLLFRRCSPDTTGDAAGFACLDDSECPGGACLWDYPDHCDSDAPNAGAYCTSDAQCAPGTCLGDEYWQPCPVCNPVTMKCNGGPDQGNDCEPQTPDLGPAYPNTQDCMPPANLAIAKTHMPNPLQTGTATLAAPDGQFCGYCRDVLIEGSLCYEGDPDEWLGPGAQFCPDSLVLADCQPSMRCIGGANAGDFCTRATQVADCDSDVCDHGDISGCGPLATTRCNSDADCYAPYETCVQRDIGALDEAAGRFISMTGWGAGPLTDGLQHAASLAGTFCAPATFSDADPNASLPGPGASSYPALFQLHYSPSGAFLGVRGSVLE